MKVTTLVRKVKTKEKTTGIIYMRVFEKNKTDFRLATNLTVIPEYWDNKRQCYSETTPESEIPVALQKAFNNKISSAIKKLNENITSEGATPNWLKSQLNSLGLSENKEFPQMKEDLKTIYLPQRPKKKGGRSLLDSFKQYLDESTFNDWHRQAQTSVMNRLQRYEKWISFRTSNPDYVLYLNEMDKEQVEDYASFMEHEHEYYAAYPEFYRQFNLRNPKWIRAVSKNTISCGLKRLFMFLNWAVNKGYLQDTSFRNVTADQQIYGTPYYLTIEERDKILYLDLTDSPRLERHRDKFIFQCLIGCRSNDLDLFTWDHISGEFLEYIPHKNLLAGRTQTVRVPLCDKAIEILERQDPESEYLFRHFCGDLYRQDIKKIVKLAGIERKVTVIDPLTRKAVQKPLYVCASSHLARRTFIGNLYKKIKDPELIASLTGHVEKSMSFIRYRDIDDDIKREVLNLIEG